jgi:hypothetical protein
VTVPGVLRPSLAGSAVDFPAPLTLADAGLTRDLVEQLLIKALHFTGELTGFELAERAGLTFPAMAPAVEALKTQQLVEIVGGTALGPPSYKYRISSLGRERAGMFLDRNMYTGVAPVPVEQYLRYMKSVAEETRSVSPRDVREAFAHLVLTDRVLDQIGPAVNAGHSLFVYGPPGNGKTVIAHAIRNLLPADLWIPHALEVGGSIISVFDPINHEPRPVAPATTLDAVQTDRRWVRCRRPLVAVGGELVLDSLELTYNAGAGFYRPPLQMLANGGVLVIDDFGRQQATPQAILNRWILPLETRVDYLLLQSGQKVAVPFMVMLAFATNIRPSDLVDEAFLRRIQYKVLAESPTPEGFARIFEQTCRDKQIEFDPSLVQHLLETIYPARNIQLRGCQPRDLIGHALSVARYRGASLQLTRELLEEACATYFVDEYERTSRKAS